MSEHVSWGEASNRPGSPRQGAARGGEKQRDGCGGGQSPPSHVVPQEDGADHRQSKREPVQHDEVQHHLRTEIKPEYADAQ